MSTLSTTNLLIIGASVRAAAYSAARAGLRPRCFDQFADADLAAAAPVVRIDLQGDEGLIERCVREGGSAPWLYTGPLENRPALVGRLSAGARLLGNGSETLRAVRDPRRLAEALSSRGLAAPALAPSEDGPPARGRWLVKPTASAGGRSVDWAVAGNPKSPNTFYYQEYIEGPTYSALYVGAGGRARLIGVVRQHPGAPGGPFLYRGGVGPILVAESTSGALRRLGAALAAEFALAGLFGVDFILKDDEPWTVEVNPRYTASVEILELSTRRALLRDHLSACVEGRVIESPPVPAGPCVGKRILYASRPIVAPTIAVRPWADGDPFAVAPIADVPRPGILIGPLEPIMTVFATAPTADECAERLDRIEAEWMGRLVGADDGSRS